MAWSQRRAPPFEGVGDQDHRGAALPAAGDHRVHQREALGVELGVGFVEQHHRGLAEQHPRQTEAATQAGRQLAHRIVLAAVETDLGQQRAQVRAAGGPVEEAGRQLKVLEHAQGFVELGVVAEIGDPTANLVAPLDDVETGDARRPAVGPDRRRQDPQQRGLPRAVAADDQQRGAGGHGEVDVDQRPAGTVPPADCGDFDGGGSFSHDAGAC